MRQTSVLSQHFVMSLLLPFNSSGTTLLSLWHRSSLPFVIALKNQTKYKIQIKLQFISSLLGVCTIHTIVFGSDYQSVGGIIITKMNRPKMRFCCERQLKKHGILLFSLNNYHQIVFHTHTYIFVSQNLNQKYLFTINFK